jgi:hypothetical protein
MSAMMAAPMADAASPIVVGDCNATVTGKPGTPISLDVGAALGQPKTLVVPIGAIPQSGSKVINDATAVKNASSGSLLSGLSGTVSGLLGQGCSVTAKTVNTAAKPVQKAAKPVTDAAKPVTKPVVEGAGKVVSPDQQSPSPKPQTPGHKPSPGNPPSSSHPGGGATSPAGRQLPTGVPAGMPLYGQLGDYGTTTSPASLYGTLPGAAPAGFTPPPDSKYGLNTPGYAPTFGKLGGPPQQGDEAVRRAGTAEALPGSQKNPLNDIGVPLLIGVIAISGVTAGLVRTWMLRKSSTA